jgi:hypothetical protein
VRKGRGRLGHERSVADAGDGFAGHRRPGRASRTEESSQLLDGGARGSLAYVVREQACELLHEGLRRDVAQKPIYVVAVLREPSPLDLRLAVRDLLELGNQQRSGAGDRDPEPALVARLERDDLEVIPIYERRLEARNATGRPAVMRI